MGKKLNNARPAYPADHDTFITIDALPRVILKDLRKRARQTQEDLAAALAVGQDTISRLERRSDMLLSTLRHYVENVGGRLSLVATFPDQPPVVIDPFGEKGKKAKNKKRSRNRTVADREES
ncbi:MAG: helix-turn-helix transcriptional regulator [Azonexus sp.]